MAHGPGLSTLDLQQGSQEGLPVLAGGSHHFSDTEGQYQYPIWPQGQDLETPDLELHFSNFDLWSPSHSNNGLREPKSSKEHTLGNITLEALHAIVSHMWLTDFCHDSI